jgi:hypothetical protein
MHQFDKLPRSLMAGQSHSYPYKLRQTLKMSLFTFIFAGLWLAISISSSESFLKTIIKCKISNKLSLNSVVEAGEGFGQYKREKGGKSNRSTKKSGAKPWDKIVPIIPIITGDMPCACNSGKVYQDCCHLHHTNTFGTYTAFNSIISSEPSQG